MEKFYVREYKKLMEHDSPVQGWTDIIVEEEILYGSVSKKEAQSFVDQRVGAHIAANSTLKETKGKYVRLQGSQPYYPWSHELTITLETIMEFPDNWEIQRFLKDENINDEIINDKPGELRYLYGMVNFPFNNFYCKPYRKGATNSVLWSREYEASLFAGTTSDWSLVQTRAMLEATFGDDSAKKMLLLLFQTPEEVLQWMETSLEDPEYLRGKTPKELLVTGEYVQFNHVLIPRIGEYLRENIEEMRRVEVDIGKESMEKKWLRSWMIENVLF